MDRAQARPRALEASGRPAQPSAGRFARALDGLLEVTIAGSFSRVGFLARRATQAWPDPPRLDGKVVIVTGASSGIGEAAARALGSLGAEVWVLGRSRARTERVAEAIRRAGGNAETALVDMADGAAVEEFSARLASVRPRLHGLVHNAGALLPDYALSADGVELTVATHVLGPFRLTWNLAPLLCRAEDAAIVTVSSGGMYSERFDLQALEMAPDRYDGVRAYARAKRAQVVLAGEWARRWSAEGVASYSVHPGWVATPGLASGLPSFTRLGPLLRRPEEGADTAVWLVAGGARVRGGGAALISAGVVEDGFWHDRRRRREHYLPRTRTSLSPEEEGRALWTWCAARTGLSDQEPGPGGAR